MNFDFHIGIHLRLEFAMRVGKFKPYLPQFEYWDPGRDRYR